MEPRKPFSSLHEDYAVTYLRRKMVPFQQLMDMLGNSDQHEVEYIEDTLKLLDHGCV
ncbi:MAG: hypothetical protein IT395_02090 [Candidatus Omnitrophica bacterium]|nr:hypothetical protein [Candidatus Omnitrophota bacterium]